MYIFDHQFLLEYILKNLFQFNSTHNLHTFILNSLKGRGHKLFGVFLVKENRKNKMLGRCYMLSFVELKDDMHVQLYLASKQTVLCNTYMPTYVIFMFEGPTSSITVKFCQSLT
jgi:hypothetical protein